MWHCRQLGRYVSVCVCVCVAVRVCPKHSHVSLTWESVEGGGLRLWYVNHSVPFHYSTIKISFPCTFLKNSNVEPRQHCLKVSKWTDGPAQKYTDYWCIEKQLVQRDHARLRQKKSLWRLRMSTSTSTCLWLLRYMLALASKMVLSVNQVIVNVLVPH